MDKSAQASPRKRNQATTQGQTGTVTSAAAHQSTHSSTGSRKSVGGTTAKKGTKTGALGASATATATATKSKEKVQDANKSMEPQGQEVEIIYLDEGKMGGTLHKALSRWRAETEKSEMSLFEDRLTQFDLYLMKIGKRMSKMYPTNIYKLNKVSHLRGLWGSIGMDLIKYRIF